MKTDIVEANSITLNMSELLCLGLIRIRTEKIISSYGKDDKIYVTITKIVTKR